MSYSDAKLIRKAGTQEYWDGVCWSDRRRAKEYQSTDSAQKAIDSNRGKSKHFANALPVIVCAVDYPNPFNS